MARTAPALYQVEVGDQSVRFEVIPGRVSELLITLRPAATELILGDTIRIATSFANLSASAIGQAVEFKVNGRLVERRTVTLGPAAIRTETFAFNPDEPGSYQIDIAGKTVQVQVVNPSGFPWAIVLASTLPELAIGMGILTWYILRRHRAQLSPQ